VWYTICTVTTGAGQRLSSTSLTTGEGGALVARQLYHPYGTVRYSEGTLPTDFTYTGQRDVPGTGLVFMHARYYHAALGRFVSADTIVPSPSNPQDFDRYAYTRNSPLRYTDPTGHYIFEEEPRDPLIQDDPRVRRSYFQWLCANGEFTLAWKYVQETYHTTDKLPDGQVPDGERWSSDPIIAYTEGLEEHTHIVYGRNAFIPLDAFLAGEVWYSELWAAGIQWHEYEHVLQRTTYVDSTLVYDMTTEGEREYAAYCAEKAFYASHNASGLYGDNARENAEDYWRYGQQERWEMEYENSNGHPPAGGLKSKMWDKIVQMQVPLCPSYPVQ
jgi:RHS repeat-associated protein